MANQESGALPRAVAALAVDGVVVAGRNLSHALDAAGIAELSDRDKPLATALAYGTVRNWLRNKAIVEELADRPFRKRDRVIEALIAVGIYALTESQRPDYAVVSATVAAAPKLHKPQLKGLVNALLRRFLREREQLETAIAANIEARWLHPAWLIDAVRADWPDDWQQILNAGNRQGPMWIRVNLSLLARDAWIARLPETVSRVDPDIPSAVLLTEALPVVELPGFSAGECSVQDIASQAAARLLNPQAGMRVLDACAAPGGKAAHLLEFCPEIAELVALDSSAARLQRVEENLTRLKLVAQVICGDACSPASWWDSQQFDRILLDAPCSATGVIRRHPDIRLLRKPGDIAALARKQLQMLHALWPLLKPGGVLLYSTCSLLRAENEDVVDSFLGSTSDARALPITSHLPGIAPDSAHGAQLLPGSADNDGFYYALMERCNPALPGIGS